MPKVAQRALSLSADERELLAARLWYSLDGEDREEVGARDAAWTTEIARRDRELENGAVEPMTVDEAMHFITSPDPTLQRP